MSIIIRLQNLPWSANALDIREFFKGLVIPEGGVHIVGGELGDAFIAFGTDEDARQAMQKTGSTLKGIQITLLLSSRAEMQKVIETARQQAMALQGYLAPTVIPTQPQQPPPTQQPQQPPSLPVPQLQQGSLSTMQPPQLSTNSPYQGQNRSVSLEAQQQMQPHMPSHMNSPSNQSLMQQPPPVPIPPPTHPHHNPSHILTHTPTHIPPPNTLAAGDSHGVVHSSSASNSEKKEDKKSSSTTSSSKRDNKGRESRRRRSKSRSRSRSRSRDRDRRRRHRSRSRSRSRDRSSRSRRRTRSRERDRGRDRNRDRDRDKDRSSRLGRDRSDRYSQETSEAMNASQETNAKENSGGGGGGEGIPGLGDIPSASMRGPLPSLSEPVKNSPIQTPSPAPSPAYTSSYSTIPPFNTGPPFALANMSVPPPSIPAPPTFPEPMVLETKDENPEGLGDIIVEQVHVKSGNQRSGHMGGGHMRAPGEGPQRSEPKGLLGDSPAETSFGNFGSRGMGFRNSESFGYIGHSGSRSLLGEHESEYGAEHYERRPNISQRGWDSKEGRDSGKQRDYRDDRDPRDRSFRNDVEMRDGRVPRDDRALKDGKDPYDERNSHDDQERLGGWESRGKRDSHVERSSRWEERHEMMEEASTWRSRGRREGWVGHDEESWGGRSDKREIWNDKENWKVDSHGWEEDPYYHRDQDRHGEEHDHYMDGYGYRGYRGRGPRGPERGRMIRGGRGFSSRFGGYQEGYMDEGHDDGYGYRGMHRGRGSHRGRGGSYNYREGGPEWGDESSCSVEIRNVSPTSSYRVIREIFRGIYVPKTGIKLLVDDEGNRTDVALLQFSSPRDAQKALRCSGTYLFDKKVEINLISETAYETAVDVNHASLNKSYSSSTTTALSESSYICISGLPVGCADHDVAQLLGGFKIQDIVLEREKGSRQPSGRCFVQLNSPMEAQQAVDKLSSSASIDGSPLRIEVCSPDAMTPAVRDRDKIQSGSQSTKSQQDQKVSSKEKKVEEKKTEIVNENDALSKQSALGADLLTDSVVMKGVPKDATEANIRDFFSDEGLVPEAVHFCSVGTNGLREVYVMFPLIENARRGVGKSQQQLCKAKVEVEMIAKPIVMTAMGLPFDPLELIRKGQKSVVIGKDENGTESSSIDEAQTGLSKDTEESDLKEENPSKDQSKSNQNQTCDEESEKEHTSRIEQQNSSFYSSSVGMGQGPYRGQYPGGPRGYRPRGDMRGMNRMPLGMSPRGPSDGSFNRMRGSMPLLRDPVDKSTGSVDTMGTAIPPEDFGKPGCVVALSNVPYRATTDDILEFFQDFASLRPENIIRRYNEFNQPTADARVSLPSPQEAQRAVQTMNRKYMSNRPIFITIVSE